MTSGRMPLQTYQYPHLSSFSKLRFQTTHQSLMPMNPKYRQHVGSKQAAMRILRYLLVWLQLWLSVTCATVSFQGKRKGPTILQLKTDEEKDEGLVTAKEDAPLVTALPTPTIPSILDRFFPKPLTCNIPTTYVIATGAIAAVVKGLSSGAVRRAFFFWRHASPIIVHYKFTQWWLEASRADRKTKDRIYDRLHDRYCEPSLNIILNLKGCAHSGVPTYLCLYCLVYCIGIANHFYYLLFLQIVRQNRTSPFFSA